MKRVVGGEEFGSTTMGGVAMEVEVLLRGYAGPGMGISSALAWAFLVLRTCGIHRDFSTS